jgi:hypothetical protein
MMFRLLVLSTVVVLFGCTHSQPSLSSKDFTLRVTMEHLPKRDAWRATFHTSQPTTSLVFDRQVNRFRAKNWKPLTEGVTIIYRDNKEQIISSSPFQEASFEFDSYYEMTPKDYEFFQAFSDGSVVMYTGHLNACPENKECNLPVEFSFVPRTDERGIVLGAVFNSANKWMDQTSRGTYVYFGTIKPMTTKFLTAIIDPKLPKWIYNKLDALLPMLFEHYAKRTGEPLTFRPFVFLNYIASGEGNNSRGGTLPGLIQMTLQGSGWSIADQESFIDLARFFAHESAHIWNGQLFPYASGDMWMHEGGADAFAYLALYELKYIDKKRFLDFQTEAFNYCLSSIKNRPLMDVKEDPNFRSHYRCGSMLALLTHSAALKQNKSHDLFYFWNQLFEEAKTSGKPYTESMYFSVLDRITQNQNLSNAMKALLRGPIKSAKEAYLEEFKNLGVQVVSSESSLPREYQRRVGMDIIRLLMKQDCAGKYGLSGSSHGIETESIESCKAFKTSMYVSKINQISVMSKGAKAYDDVRKTCLTKGAQVSLTVGKPAKHVLVDCPDGVPVRESYLRIVDIPLER